MSGVRTRSRLEELQSLRRRTEHEIINARRHDQTGDLGRLQLLAERLDAAILADGGTLPVIQPVRPGSRTGRTPKPRPTRRQKAEDHVTRRLEELGVTSTAVKVWAVSVGLIDRVRRGRIRGSFVEAYAAHHQTNPITTEDSA
jgi:hypothetical protein